MHSAYNRLVLDADGYTGLYELYRLYSGSVRNHAGNSGVHGHLLDGGSIGVRFLRCRPLREGFWSDKLREMDISQCSH